MVPKEDSFLLSVVCELVQQSVLQMRNVPEATGGVGVGDSQGGTRGFRFPGPESKCGSPSVIWNRGCIPCLVVTRAVPRCRRPEQVISELRAWVLG